MDFWGKTKPPEIIFAGVLARARTPLLFGKWEVREIQRLSHSLCDKFNLCRSDQSLCPLCMEWFLPLPVFTPILLRYIADTLNFSKQRS